MIELINQDYADFVNLSTNLVGLDEGIDKIKEPLVGYNDEIKLAKENLSSCLDQVKAKLSRQERIRQEKEMLGDAKLAQGYFSLTKITLKNPGFAFAVALSTVTGLLSRVCE